MTKQIPLTQGQFSLVDDEDYEFLIQWKWQHNQGRYASRTHREKMGRGVYSEKILMHRIINKTPDGLVTDHINGNKLDNRRSNLRTCTKGQNNCNRASLEKSSKYKGVSWSKSHKKWRSQIGKSSKTIGTYDSEIEAALAYNHEAKKIYGDFAYLNLIAASCSPSREGQHSNLDGG